MQWKAVIRCLHLDGDAVVPFISEDLKGCAVAGGGVRKVTIRVAVMVKATMMKIEKGKVII